MDRLRLIFGIDLRTLALFRAGAALIILTDLGIRLTDLSAHYSDSGLMPRALVSSILSDRGPFSLHMASGEAWFQLLLFIAATCFAIQLLFGYRTRIASMISWGLLVSLHLRNPAILSGADLLLAVLMFWGMFLPLGARWSVDAALDPNNHKHANLHCSIASAAMLVQVMSVYFFTAFLKSGPEWWPEGSAVYYALHIDMYVTPLGTWIRDWPLVLQFFSYLVLVLEYVCPVLIFIPIFTIPIRLICLALLMSMHIGFELFLELGLFPHTSLLSLSLFIPGVIWDRLGQRNRAKRESVQIFYDPPCVFCRRISKVFAQLMLLPSSVVQSADQNSEALALLQRENSWVVHSSEQVFCLRFDAFLALLKVSPLWFWLVPLLRLPPIHRMGDRVYRWVANNRKDAAESTALFLRERCLRLQNPRPVNVLVLVIASLVFVSNWQTIPQTGWTLPEQANFVLRQLRLEQRWSMFAPWPSKDEGWYVIRGHLEDGRVADVYEGQLGEPDASKPQYISQTFPTYRWRKLLNNIRVKRGEVFRLPYAQYLCRDWNGNAEVGERLKDFEIIFYNETTLPNYQEPKLTPRVLWVHDCLASANEMLDRKRDVGLRRIELNDG